MRYILSGKRVNGEVPKETVTAKVFVVKKEEAQKLADSGVAVETDEGTKKNSKGEEVTRVVANQNASNVVSGGNSSNVAKPSGSSTNSGTTKPSTGSTGTTSKPSSGSTGTTSNPSGSSSGTTSKPSGGSSGTTSKPSETTPSSLLRLLHRSQRKRSLLSLSRQLLRSQRRLIHLRPNRLRQSHRRRIHRKRNHLRQSLRVSGYIIRTLSMRQFVIPFVMVVGQI